MPYPHYFIKLTPEEEKRIEKEIERLTLLRKWEKRKPLQALYLSNEKKILKDIAKYLKVDYSTVRNWFRRFRKQGLDGFIRWINRPGPIPPKRQARC